MKTILSIGQLKSICVVCNLPNPLEKTFNTEHDFPPHTFKVTYLDKYKRRILNGCLQFDSICKISDL